ncbi:hypothetical protein C0V75_19750 [Tabrizicola sp. TH137]|uniref:GspMb/PilO family protein n=1 Tax=Tabrizicola sp. TH137 TaxID=2067452 RepID=UPI000C7A4A0D|nr:GspMb/PilO family protein [Tabrizicola sp. TH137]PLL10564.1 hypothetical protein C0V75_19750 [Tabrizicola sp. TH137]
MSRALTGVLALAAVGAGGALFWLVTEPMQDAIAARQDRLAGIVKEEAALAERIAEFGSGVAVPELPPAVMLPGATRAEAELALQERLAVLAEAAGVMLTSLREGAAPEGVTQPTVAVLAEGEGGYAEVAALIAALEAETVPLGVEELVLRPVVEGQQRVTLRLSVWGFIGGEAG